ncbi:hypothetical protein JCM10914A_22180 [Paenibacillus sp. JCM 10914]|uniref:hypothetical protein n=1 Tax=Paenibacillus sp. JCM 10914 TaxID=1236974 RepID=UPI0003CC86A3|nr:hypothetical protein [Paenibacillus sp. JCM 10914]GAE09796.1 hypothetical protein JCM10914_6183 [Paenibacillus sp. JCM 10914]
MEEPFDKAKLFETLDSGLAPSVAKVVLSALGGIPIAGSVAGAAGAAWSEFDQKRFQKLLLTWLKLQEEEIVEVGKTLAEVMLRIDQTDELTNQRIQSPEYLSLIKRCLRDWSAAESEEKRVLIRNLLINAAAVEQICSDDIIRIFIKWIDIYNESHFKIIREIHREPGITRYEMWIRIYGAKVREDSAEADLFKLLIHELSLGMIIRQYREKDKYGNFLKKSTRRSSQGSRLMASAFDEDKEYHLTELGRWFVHYTMNEEVMKIEDQSRSAQEE